MSRKSWPVLTRPGPEITKDLLDVAAKDRASRTKEQQEALTRFYRRVAPERAGVHAPGVALGQFAQRFEVAGFDVFGGAGNFRFGVVHLGRLIAEGPIDELRAGRRLEDVFVDLVGAHDDEGGALGWLGGKQEDPSSSPPS